MSRAHVMLVDDDRALVRSMTATLESRGLVVHAARDAESAIELASERQLAVIILDIVLPGQNGFQLCRQLKREHPETHIVMFSGKDEPADRLWAKEVGATALFRKPSELTTLTERVAELANQ